jgi:hypothetical protein
MANQRQSFGCKFDKSGKVVELCDSAIMIANRLKESALYPRITTTVAAEKSVKQSIENLKPIAEHQTILNMISNGL